MPIDNLDGILDDEIRGDWNNLRGTEYHLVYALWLLMLGKASQVAFYQGNDLLARPTPPPALVGSSRNLPTIPVHVEQDNQDLWIQVKATSSKWTLSKLLSENLLLNYVCNARRSQATGRGWQVRLVTQGQVDRSVLEQAINKPSDRLLRSVDDILRKLENDTGAGPPDVQASEIRDLVLSILGKLALTVPIPLSTLKAEIETELAYAYPDREAVRQIANTLLGALLRDAAAGPEATRVYDINWLNSAAGRPVKNRGLLDTDPIAACSESVNSALRTVAPDWNPALYAPRPRLATELQRFLDASGTVFVLLGVSGTGKSWAMAEWITHELDRRTRLLMPGSDLDREKDIPSLVALRLSPYTGAEWSHRQFLRRLRATATIEGFGPLVIVIDNLLPPWSQPELDLYRRDLERMVQFCADNAIKLVLTCQCQTWELWQLHKEIPPYEIFLPLTQIGQERKPYSYLLSELTPDEQAEILQRRLPIERANRAAGILRAPAFNPLRIPYLLKLYLEQHMDSLGQSGSSAPVQIDDLLDLRVERLLNDIVHKLTCTKADLESAFNALLRELWLARANGLAYVEAVRPLSLHLSDQSEIVLQELRRAGLLMAEGNLRMAEPAVAERLFAKYLGEKLAKGDDVCEELRQDDHGVVTALLRSVVTDPVLFAEKLLAMDSRWAKAIAEGLAQCSAEDYRVLAFLSVLARPGDDGAVGFEGADALGQLAARGRRAWKWAAAMYLGDNTSERFRGDRALATTFEYYPRRVGAAIRLRLSRAARIDDFFSEGREKREQQLRGSLAPLRHINHGGAARVAMRILSRYGHLVGQKESQFNYEFMNEVDIARGLSALFTDETAVQSLLSDLSSHEPIVRRRAACAVRPIAFERPEVVEDALYMAICKEQRGDILNRLLWAAYPLSQTAPNRLLEALENSAALNWSEAPCTAGLALTLLSSLAGLYPDRVMRLLPRRLDHDEPYARAFLSEILAYAWWCFAEHVTDGRSHLAILAKPDLNGVPNTHRPFAVRGAAIAQLGLICLDTGLSASELRGLQMLYPDYELQFLFLLTNDFVRRHAATIAQHSDYTHLRSLLLECLREEQRWQVHPRDKGLRDSQYRCARLSLEMLIQLATRRADPLSELLPLPDDWQSLHAAWRLLEAGLEQTHVVEFARSNCAKHTHGRSAQAIHERRRCLAQLALLETDPGKALDQYRTESRSSLDTSGPAHGLAKLTDANPEETLSLLDDSIRTEKDLPTLFYWEHETSSWRALLIARVYARMFSDRPISVREALELCEQMLTSIRSLPKSDFTEQYKDVYGALASWLQGRGSEVHAITSRASVLQSSHSLAIDLLNQARSAVSGEHDAAWMYNWLLERKGMWETENYRLKEGSLSDASGYYLLYVFPSVRLTFVAVGKLYHLADPAARLMKERKKAHEHIRKYSWVFDDASTTDQARLELVLSKLQDIQAEFPRDERPHAWSGLLLLKLGRFAEAEDVLKKCLILPSCNDEIRASALYNLACVYARMARENECQCALEESAEIRRLDPEWMTQDPDLEPIRDKPWFGDMISKTRDC